MSKFRHHVPALALALRVIEGGIGPVTLQSTERALALAEYFESHARRLHSSGRRLTVRAARTIIDKARASALPDAFTARDVYRNQWAGLSDRVAAADALDQEMGFHVWVVVVGGLRDESASRPAWSTIVPAGMADAFQWPCAQSADSLNGASGAVISGLTRLAMARTWR